MINRKEAVEIFNKKYPDREIKEIRIYKNSGYLFTAPVKGVEIDFGDPFFFIGDDKKVKSYSPVEDMDNFINSRVISS